ncbi:MAG: thiolase family protein [Eubacteriaceae bacterium]|jgi:acetyl-CoA C-acetyltransferase|nr:thiolase family protein [Eubacteriaceae bacterium]
MSELHEVYAVSACRTPIGDFLGSLSSLTNVELGTIVAEEAINRAGIEKDAFEEVTCGMIYKGGSHGNPARQIQYAVGLPYTGYACTIDQLCGSAMRATEILSQQIMLGKTNVGLVIGTESMSKAPYILNDARTIRMGDKALCDAITYDGLNCPISGYHMGVTAENLAEEFNISREEQDELAMQSQNRASDAIDAGKFKDEIVPVTVKKRKGDIIVERDEHPRHTDMEQLAKLRPAFKKDGTVTAGNASGINDGAAAMVLVSGEMVEKLNLKPIARLVATASAGVEAQRMGFGPAVAIPKVLDYAGLKKDDIAYWEINEAFAAQFIACERSLQLPRDIVNINGSGIALGHPVGCTGVRIQVSLFYEMMRRHEKYGCASLCVGGGPAMAAVWEMCY